MLRPSILSDSVSAFPDILSTCKKIYMPVREDTVSKAKLEQYEAMLRIMEYPEIIDKTETFTIPFISTPFPVPSHSLVELLKNDNSSIHHQLSVAI